MRVVSLALAAAALVACSRGESPPPPSGAPREATPAAAVVTPIAETAPRTAEVAPAPRTLAGKTVLHVGDSMVGGTFGLTRALETKLTAAGAKIVRSTKVSETLLSFDSASGSPKGDKGPGLRDLLRTHEPDIVIVNLGTNDATVPFPEAYAHHVANIAKRIGPRECWWIGPPSWKGPDAGIVKVLRDNAAPCRFFDSSKLELERANDGIHPNDRGAGKWADAFWEVFVDPARPG